MQQRNIFSKFIQWFSHSWMILDDFGWFCLMDDFLQRSLSFQEARRRERIAHESAKARGAQSVSAQTVGKPDVRDWLGSIDGTGGVEPVEPLTLPIFYPDFLAQADLEASFWATPAHFRPFELLVAMVRGARKALAVGVAVAVACGLQKHLNFVPGPRHAAPVAAAAASMMMAPAAFADEIGDAAKKLGDASYSFAKEVDWNNGIFLQAPGKFQPLEALKAIDKMIDMGAAADPKLLKDAAEAHHKAIGSISGPNGVTSRADWDAVNAAIGRVVASVPKAKVMAVYDSVKAITDPGVPAYMKSLVNGPDAEKAYQGFLEFKDVVEKNQVATAGAPAVVPSGDKIGEAAKALSDASYPFIKDIDWLSDIYLKPLPGKTAPETLKAIDKMIVMGAKMDGNLLKAAAEAHHKAIGSIDATGVTSAADYEAVNAAIGRLVASVPKTTVMDVYNSMAGVVDSSVPNNMFSKVNPLDAVAAAKGFYTFKDVVEASQRWKWRPSAAWSCDIASTCFSRTLFKYKYCIDTECYGHL